jgi:hypothetical protein
LEQTFSASHAALDWNQFSAPGAVVKRSIVAICSVLSILAAHAANDNAVPYPDGYLRWHHVKSMVIQPGHALYESFGGIHHLYANDKAVAGYESGQFPDGSVIAFDLFAAEDANHAIVAGERKVLGVMYRDHKRYAATGGWGFEGFAGGKKDQRVVGNNAVAACFGCHMSQQQHDYVFSSM